MTYNEFIQNIIDTRGQWGISKDEYFETHHIVPECLGGQPPKPCTKVIHDNLIWLYPEEHFIAHKLLAEENPDNLGLVSAYWRMATDGRHLLTPEEYAQAKLLWVAKMKQLLTGRTWSEESRIKLRGRPCSEETRLKLSKAGKGRVWSKESREKLSNSKKGCKSWREGKKFDYKPRPSQKGRVPWNKGLTKDSDERVANYSKKSCSSRKGKKLSEEHVINSANGHKKKVICIETGQIFDCAKDAVNIMGLNISNKAIGSVCRGQSQIAGGYHWKYVQEDKK